MNPATVSATAILACSLCAGALAQAPHSHHHSFTDAEKWARSFDDPKRDAWQKPHQVISALALASDAVVADIGAGTGYFATRLAHMVPNGRVYGVDTETDMVAYLERRARQEGLKNLLAVKGGPEDPKLPEPVDLILMVDVYHHVAERAAYFGRLRQNLKPGGRVAIIDFNARSKIGPPVRERIAADQVRSEMRTAGYRPVLEPDFLPNQYFLVFQADTK